MLGEESRERIEGAERCRERERLLHLAYPEPLIRFRRDVAWNLLDRLLDGPEPKPSRWSLTRPWEILVWRYWQVWSRLQAQRSRLDAAATL